MTAQEIHVQNRIKLRVLQVVVAVILLIMLGRLVQLQILDYEKYGPLSVANSLRQEHVNPARGLIFDRSGRILVDNQPIYTITVTPASFRREIIPLLSDYLDMPQDVLLERVQRAQSYSWHRPSRLVSDIRFDQFSKIQENIWKLPEIDFIVESKRNYPTDVRASHILGYLSEVTREEYRASTRYNLGDKAGRTGLEFVYEPHLRGQLGARYIRVNAMGQALGVFDEEQWGHDPDKGSDIYTHIDPELQNLAEELMEGKVGGLVAMDPNTGAVLALVSSPTYDVQRLSGRIDMDYWRSLQNDPSNPIFNRAISTMQPPGSTVKPLMGLVGLEMGIIDPQTTVACRGGFTRGRFYRCTRDHGRQNLVQAIENSCNTYFFWLMVQMMEREGLNAWNRLTGSFGLGRLSGIDLPNERRGILPDSAYYNTHFGGPRDWGIGDLISVGVGQGTFSSSPLQMALMTSIIANGGYTIQPHIVDRVVHDDGSSVVHAFESERIPWVKDEHLRIVKEGMRLAVTEGSGRFYADIAEVAVAGKTGTAQNPHGENHGWFVSYAPYENPEIAIAVLVENAGFGSVSAAPVAGLLMEQYFHGRILRQWVYDYVRNFQPRVEQQDQDEQTAEELF